ncbi:AT-rich interactive domain-containing protein 5B-like [Symphorus nematophorus]
MEPGALTWVGSPCGLHGPYIFYKAFGFNRGGQKRLLSLGDFFLVRCQPVEPLCIAELQLLWEDRTNQQLLSSSKLYFLPEDTPQGRSAGHGQDEVIAVSQKVVVRLEDLVKWTVWDQHAWNRGMKALPLKMNPVKTNRSRTDSVLRYHDSTPNRGLHFKDVLKEKAALGEGLGQKQVLVLSYPRYCRYCSVVARLREQSRSLLTNQVVLALGGITVMSEDTHILYCRDTFHHPTLLHNKSVCDEFAPNLKGRPRKKKLLSSLYRDSQGQSQGSEVKGQTSLSSTETKATAGETPVRQYREEEQAFLVSLYKYMKDRKTPIERIPYLGFKQINLWTLFQAVQKLGGYELITARRQWKNVYNELGGNPRSTSAATCTRRHYERLILPYERFVRGDEEKPLPQLKPRKEETSSNKGTSNSTCTLNLKTNPSPEKKDTLGSKDQDHSRSDLMEQNFQLKLRPQICIARLDPLQPSHCIRKRQSPAQDCQNDTEIQLMLQPKVEMKSKRRYSGCDPSCLTTSPMTKDIKSVFPLAAPMISNHAHSAVDLWQHQQVPLQDQCHVGKPRNLQSPSIPEPPSEQAELPRTEDTSSGFENLCNSSGVGKVIVSPLAKKKHLLQEGSTGLPKQDHSNFGQPPALITSSLSNCIMEEAAERSTVARDSSVVVHSRPSVIQHVESFKARVQKDEIKESTPAPFYSHKHHSQLVPPSHSPLFSHQKKIQCLSPPLLTPRMPRSSWTPKVFPNDLFSSFSRHHCWHRPGEEADGTVKAELVHDGSEQPQEEGATHSRNPYSLVGFFQSADQDKSSNSRTTVSDDQPTDLSLPKSSLKALHHPYKCSTRYQESTSMLSQNGLTDANVTHNSRARRVLPLTVSPANTRKTRQGPSPCASATGEARISTARNGVVKKVGDEEEQERLKTALYCKMSKALGSQVGLHNTCVARPLNKLGNSLSWRKRQAVTPNPKGVLSLPPSRMVETPKELDDRLVGQSADGAEGGAAASSFSLRNPTPSSGTCALSQVQNLCRDTLSITLTMDQLHGSDCHLQDPLQCLKTQSTDFVSPLVPPTTNHSLITQRQRLVQAAASPTQVYQHHRLHSVSVNPQPTFCQPQLNSVHRSTKLP